MALIDIAGRVFGNWTVIRHVAGAHWLCVCSCGVERNVRGDGLRDGTSASCGCRSGEVHLKHGMVKSPEYRIWKGIKYRCFNSRAREFKWYGGRGITMFAAWKDSFVEFFNYVGKRPSPRHEIDRFPNNDGNYEPGNVRWALPIQQQRNTSANHLVNVGGRMLCASEAAEIVGIKADTLIHRLNRGWSDEMALTHPVRDWGRS